MPLSALWNIDGEVIVNWLPASCFHCG